MKMYAVVGLLLMLAAGVESCNEHDKAAYKSCIMNFQASVPDVSNPYIVPYSAQQLTDLCSVWTTARTCAPNVAECSIEQGTWDNLKDSYDYLCLTSSISVLTMPENQACVSGPSLLAMISSCDDTRGAEMYAAGFNYSRQCAVLDRFSGCVEDGVEAECGEELADWYDGFLEAVLRTYRRIFNCPVTAVAGVESCDSCLTNFQASVPDYSDPYIFHYSAQQLIDLCSNWTTARTCALNVAGCFEQIYSAVQKDIFDYLCLTSSISVVTKPENQACALRPSILAMISSCETDMPATTDFTSHCLVLDRFSGCVEDGVEAECGEELADWYDGFLEAGLRASCSVTAGVSARPYSPVLMMLVSLLCYLTHPAQ